MGAFPTGTVAGSWPQPEVRWPLHVRPLTTDTVLSSMLVTYTVWVLRSTVRVLGLLPTVTVGQGPAQDRMSAARQRRVSITLTVLPPAGSPLALLPLAT